MKESERRKIFEEYEKLKKEIAESEYSYIHIGSMIEFLQKNALGNINYWVDKYCKIFSQELAEKNWERAYAMVSGSCLDMAKMFRDPGNQGKPTELTRQLAEALKRELGAGNRAVRKKLSAVYCLLEETDKAILLWKQLAEDGNPIAQFNLARIYEYYANDENSAYYWYKKAADGEHEIALNLLPNIEKSRRRKEITVGVFWGIPDEEKGKQVIAGLGVVINEDIRGEEINSVIYPPFNHFNIEPRSSHRLAFIHFINDIDFRYKYPRMQLAYDKSKEKYIITADECIKQECIDELISLFKITDYELRRDETYTCQNCEKEKGVKK